MKKIAITADKTAIVELTHEDLEVLETMVNSAWVYAQRLIENNVDGYCDERSQHFCDGYLFNNSNKYWHILYTIETEIEKM